MIKKTITFNDFNGDEQTETHHFHLTEADITLYEFSRPGGLSTHLKDIVATNDLGAILNEFKYIVDLAHGTRSADGRLFSKTPEGLKAFQASGAYSALYMELATDTEAAVAFVNGIMPKERKDHLAPAQPKQSGPTEVSAADGQQVV